VRVSHVADAEHRHRVLAIHTDSFGGFGGIAKYNRDLLTALCEDPNIIEVVGIPRMAGSALGPLPPSLTLDCDGIRGIGRFIRTAFSRALRDRPFDIVFCGHINHAPLGWLLAKIAGARWILQLHGIEAWQPHSNPLVRYFAGRADAILSVSQITAGRFQSWRNAPAERLHVVPLALDANEFGPGPKSSVLIHRYNLEGKTIIMTFGRLAGAERSKGFDEVLEALPALREARPDLVYLIAGVGEDRRRLEAKAALLGVADAVVFTGLVEESEKVDLYRLADAYVMPSHGEGFGYVLLEAMACGVPVIASTLDGGREAVRNGMLGMLVDPNDRQALVRSCLAAIDLPKAVPEGFEFFRPERYRLQIQEVVANILALNSARSETT
jgi:phosphatidylinositol alpha-1,6-mannosyltransferase